MYASATRIGFLGSLVLSPPDSWLTELETTSRFIVLFNQQLPEVMLGNENNIEVITLREQSEPPNSDYGNEGYRVYMYTLS